MIINEYLCMKLAERVGIPVAKVHLEYFGEPVLIVERFDRFWENDYVNKIHMIDACQLLDLPPTYKYERPFGSSGHASEIKTGVSLLKLFESAKLCKIPAKAGMDILNWTLFQLIIGNSDAHGKNISFFVGENGIMPAPAYDILNINIYDDLFNHEMAMAFGDEFVWENILAFQLAEFCEDCKLQPRMVANNLKKLCDSVLKNIEFLNTDIFKNDNEIAFAHELIEDIKVKANRFKIIALELVNVKL